MARQIEEAGCGLAFSVGAHAELASAIRELASDPARVATMGECARGLWAERYQRKQALATWQALLTRLSAGPQAR
jgi:glycosyltransferase involved in cell wall biosynthesis